jgi:hypothetical protein
VSHNDCEPVRCVASTHQSFTAGLKYSSTLALTCKKKLVRRNLRDQLRSTNNIEDTLLRISLQNVQRSLSCILPEEESWEQSTSEEFLVDAGTKHVKEGRPKTPACAFDLMLLSPLPFRGKKKNTNSEY